MLRKLQLYKELPPNYQFLAAMPTTEVLEYVAKVEQDPFVIYTSIEEVYKPNFLEPAVFKKFAHLFDDNAESKFVEQIEAIRASVVDQIALF